MLENQDFFNISLKVIEGICLSKSKKVTYPGTGRLLVMQRYEGGSLYAALPLHMQSFCFWIRICDLTGHQGATLPLCQ